MVFEKLREIISEQLEISEELITMESNIRDDFDADSLDFVDIVMSIEDEFNVEVPDEAIDDIKVVGDLVRFIEENK
ncbi:MAG: acyl carrier protein [Oscillospiraceae bacterium]|nr:acyl carrier protein [Oscillospiraceae bacterium]MBR6518904.1 acyl carrier protein [Oscillospiraceae bacterium]